MSLQNLDFSRAVRRPDIAPLFGVMIGGEGEILSDTQTQFTDHDLWFSGMQNAPDNISDVIVTRLAKIPNVHAIRMGRSGDVYHIWTMIGNWTATDRKDVYAAQRDLLNKLQGFDLDFYVVKLDANASPDELVSDIPMVFPIAR